MKKLKTFINHISPVSEAAWEETIPLFTRRQLPKGALFTEVGKVSRKIAFLEEGVLRAYYSSPEGATYNKHFFMPPCFIGGYTSLITGLPNQITQEALTDCVIWETNHKLFTALYDKHQDIERVARITAEHYFIQKEQREIDIVLLEADKRYDIFQKDYPNLEQLIPQYHIASYLGITPTQLSRIRRKRAEGE